MEPVRPADHRWPSITAGVNAPRRTPGGSPPDGVESPAQTPGVDRVELSPAADRAEISESRTVAESRLDEVRAQIAAGTYLTPDKIDYVVERLYEELRGQ